MRLLALNYVIPTSVCAAYVDIPIWKQRRNTHILWTRPTICCSGCSWWVLQGAVSVPSSYKRLISSSLLFAGISSVYLYSYQNGTDAWVLDTEIGPSQWSSYTDGDSYFLPTAGRPEHR